MRKIIVSTVACAALCAGSAYAAESLSDLKAYESGSAVAAAVPAQSSSVDRVGRLGSGAGDHSPSQVVILNNTPNTNQGQEQNQISEQDQDQSFSSRQRQRARIGVGTGQSLELLRETRIQKEAKNEQILIEKLEDSRLEDEKSRLRRLFKIRQYNQRRHEEMGEGGEFGSLESDYTHKTDIYAHAPKAHAPTVVVAAPSIVKPDAPEAHVGSGYSSYKPTNTWGSKKHYIKGQIGMGDYSDADNAFSTTSWGVAIGKELSTRLYGELGLYKTSYEIYDPFAVPVGKNCGVFGCESISNSRDLDQYNLSAILGWKLIQSQGVTGSIRGGLSYVRRDSESSDIEGVQSFRSNTIDGLIGVGADVEIARNLSVTASFDYYSNLLNDIASTDLDVVENVEESDYYVLGIGLKLNF